MASLTRALLAGLLCVACGDPVAPSAWQGAPVARFTAFVDIDQPPAAELLEQVERRRMAVFWGPIDARFDDGTLVEQTSTTRPFESAQVFTYHLFDVPPAEAMTGGFAIGRVVLYRDDDGDERYGPTDPLIGATANLGLLYVSTSRTAAESPTGVAVEAGFHMVQLPLSRLCGLPSPPSLVGCEAPLGEACDRDTECGPGECLIRGSLQWPGGACVVSPLACRPVNSAWSALEGVFIKACRQASDCTRRSYRCDRGTGGCVPDPGLVMLLGKRPSGAAFCGAPSAR